MDIILTDIDQFNVRNLIIAANQVGAALGRRYILFKTKSYYASYTIIHIPKEIYNIVYLDRINIFFVNVTGFDRRIINLHNIREFIFEKSFLVEGKDMRKIICVLKYNITTNQNLYELVKNNMI